MWVVDVLRISVGLSRAAYSVNLLLFSTVLSTVYGGIEEPT